MAVNPSFRVFIVDEKTMLPIKIETHYLDVKERPMPQWKLSHELTEHYKLKDLSPKSFEHLSNKMLFDSETALQYQVTKGIWGPETFREKCPEQCRRQQYCQSRSSTYGEQK